MSDKLRSVNTKFWDDPFIEGLTPTEKLLFLYLLTNPLTSLLGIYEITLKRISYDTGINTEMVRKGFERFTKDKKAYFLNNFVILPNFLKNQNLNSNMKIAVAKQFNNLPKHMKVSILGNDLESLGNDSKAFETIRECFGKYEIEIESEVEGEKEIKIWKTDFEIYKTDLKNSYDLLISNSDFIKEQERLNPNVDIKLTIEKACINFWNTEAGWKNKKQARINDINWKSTFVKAITSPLNKVYKQNGKSNELQNTFN